MDIHTNQNDLISLAIKGDLIAQKKLFEGYFGYVMSISLRYMSSKEEAEEVLNDVFLKVFIHLDHYNPVYPLKGWIRKIAVNTAIDKLRASKNHPLFLDLKYIDGATSNEDEFVWDEEKVILPVIQDLSPGYRAVFNLYVFEEYTHKEIARLLGISEGTSKSNYARAKQILKKRIENQSTLRKGNMSLFIKSEPL